MALKDSTLTQERLKEVLHYNPETGVFVWLVGTRNTNAGDIAGWKREGQYARVGLDKKLYLQHRIAWLYMVGSFPENEIDHINQEKSDNRWVNLRCATSRENSMNMPRRRDNSSGHTGVYWCKRDKAFLAQIRIEGKQIALGYFDDFFEAVCCRKSAENKYGFSSNHGK